MSALQNSIDAVVSKKYVSTNQTITTGGALTLTHGLPLPPYIVIGWLICLTAENGYSIGDRVLMNPAEGSVTLGVGNNNGISIVITATTIVLRFGSANPVFINNNKTTGASVTLTNANWALLMSAYS